MTGQINEGLVFPHRAGTLSGRQDTRGRKYTSVNKKANEALNAEHVDDKHRS